MKVLMIYNPVAGQRDVAHDLDRVITYLRSQDWQVDLRKTLGHGDATTYAREAAHQGYDMVVAVGGDGTLGQAANGLVGTDCALGVLPVGTGNVWAHMLGLPVWTPLYRQALLDAARVLVDGQTQRIDLGQANERYFMLWSGIGFDAQVTHHIEPHQEMRRSFGNLTYVITALVTALGMRGTRSTITIDGHSFRQRLIMVIVSNAQLYGPSWRIAPQAQLDDGLLDVYIFKGVNVLDVFYHLFLILSGKHTGDPKVETYKAKRIQIKGDKPLPLHLDGDPYGHTPISISVIPKAINVVVPKWASGSLFEEGEFDKEAPTLAVRIADRLRYERGRWRQGRDRLLQQGERIYSDWEYRILYGTKQHEDEEQHGDD